MVLPRRYRGSWAAAFAGGLAAACFASCAPETDLRHDGPADADGWGTLTPQGSGLVRGADAAIDDHPPVVTGLVVDVTDCARVRFTVSEPATAVVILSVGETRRELAAQAQGASFALLASLGDFPSGANGTLVVRATDLAGNQTTSEGSPFEVPAHPAPVVITEVLANPAGSEYTQEWVEILNAGPDAVSLAGFTIEDAGGADPLPDVALPVGQRALIVAADYAPDDPADPAPGPDAILLRVAGRIGRDGLGNAGEAVTLRTPDGRVASRYPGHLDMGATRWNGRSTQRVPADLPCDAPELWTREPERPTPGY